jgi:tetratricopeptide (TPR) repeat protein
MKSVVFALGAMGVVCAASSSASAEDLTWCKQAIASQEAKSFERAITEINRCIDTGSLVESNLAVALHNRGIAFVDLERAEEAVEDFTASLRLRPDHANSHFRRAHALHLIGQLNAAIDDYTTVLRIDPNDNGAYLYRGAAWHDMGQFARAVEDYTLALRIDPNDRDAYVARSKAYESMGMTELAEKDRKASQRN